MPCMISEEVALNNFNQSCCCPKKYKSFTFARHVYNRVGQTIPVIGATRSHEKAANQVNSKNCEPLWRDSSSFSEEGV